MFHYSVFEEESFSEDLGHYTSFGIEVTDSNKRVILSVADVSTEKDVVSNICLLCNKAKLSPIHLLDVLEDSLL